MRYKFLHSNRPNVYSRSQYIFSFPIHMVISTMSSIYWTGNKAIKESLHVRDEGHLVDIKELVAHRKADAEGSATTPTCDKSHDRSIRHEWQWPFTHVRLADNGKRSRCTELEKTRRVCPICLMKALVMKQYRVNCRDSVRRWQSVRLRFDYRFFLVDRCE